MKHLKKYNESIEPRLDPDKAFYTEVGETCTDILYDLKDEGIDCVVTINRQLYRPSEPIVFTGLEIMIGNNANTSPVGKQSLINSILLIHVIERLTGYLEGEGISLSNITLGVGSGRQFKRYSSIEELKQDIIKSISNTSTGLSSIDKQTTIGGVIVVTYQLDNAVIPPHGVRQGLQFGQDSRWY
jgi:hypothetical protein